jgi:CheY-like chemotaxis protein
VRNGLSAARLIRLRAPLSTGARLSKTGAEFSVDMLLKDGNPDRRRVLIVDDEPVLRSLLVEIVQDLGFLTLDAGGGPEALQVLQRLLPIDLLITDVMMPVMNGRQLAVAARRLQPGLEVLFITGYVDETIRDSGLLDAGMRLLKKPFTQAALAAKISAAMKEREALLF